MPTRTSLGGLGQPGSLTGAAVVPRRLRFEPSSSSRRRRIRCPPDARGSEVPSGRRRWRRSRPASAPSPCPSPPNRGGEGRRDAGLSPRTIRATGASLLRPSNGPRRHERRRPEPRAPSHRDSSLQGWSGKPDSSRRPSAWESASPRVQVVPRVRKGWELLEMGMTAVSSGPSRSRCFSRGLLRPCYATLSPGRSRRRASS